MYEYKLDNIRVVDGDTIEADIQLGLNITVRKMIRFLGVDTWEMRGKHKEKGLAAKAELEDIVEKALYLTVETKKDKTGKYGRLLGYIWAEFEDDNLSVNRYMFENHSKIRE